MVSSEQESGYVNVRQVISAAKRQREAYLDSTLKTSTAAWAGPAGLALLFLAGLAYAAVDSASQTESVVVAKISTAATVASSADYGGAARKEQASGGFAQPADSYPAGYVSRGHDGDGNVMTYEHD
ncbi:MAG: hypothetical protein ACTS6J_04645 [Burkholderiales bacterium]